MIIKPTFEHETQAGKNTKKIEWKGLFLRLICKCLVLFVTVRSLNDYHHQQRLVLMSPTRGTSLFFSQTMNTASNFQSLPIKFPPYYPQHKVLTHVISLGVEAAGGWIPLRARCSPSGVAVAVAASLQYPRRASWKGTAITVRQVTKQERERCLTETCEEV